MENPNVNLHDLVNKYLAGNKEPLDAGSQVVPVMIEIAMQLKGESLKQFVATLTDNKLRLVTGLRDQYVGDICVLVQLRNWLVDQRLTSKPRGKAA